MKANKFSVLLLAIAALGFASCGKPSGGNNPEQPTSDAKVYFSEENIKGELDPSGDLKFNVALSRNDAAEAANVTILVSEASEGVEVDPVVKFAKDEKTANVVVSIPKGEDGKNYSVTLTVDDKNWNSFSSGVKKAVVSIAVIKWDSEGKGIFLDDAFTGYFGSSKAAWQAPYKYKKFADGTALLRVVNPWISYATADADADGVYDGCPYWDEGDIDEEGTYNFDFAIDARGNAILSNSPAYTGFTEATYGEVYIVQYAEDAFGTFVEGAGLVFDKSAEVLVMGDDDGLYNAAGIGFFFTKEAYLAATYVAPADATVETYVGTFDVKGVNYYTKNDTTLRVTITSAEDEDGQYYELVGLDLNVIAYGYFDENNKLTLGRSKGEDVELEGATYATYFYPYGSQTIVFEPAEDGSLVVASNSDATEFGILYQNADDDDDYFFSYIILEPTLVPVVEEGGEEESQAPAKVKAQRPARNGKATKTARQLKLRK